jgi:transposase-like protein
MDERLRFAARLLEGDKMAVLCREFGISRKTGYKLYRRYRDIGLEGLTDRSRRPYRPANQLPFQVESRIVQLRKEHPTWAAPSSGSLAPITSRPADRFTTHQSGRCTVNSDPSERGVNPHFRTIDGVAQFVRVSVSCTRTRSRSSQPSLLRM